jgi:membrane-bound ClpP family serine protease
MKKLSQNSNAKLGIILISLGIIFEGIMWFTLGMLFSLVPIALIIAGIIVLATSNGKAKENTTYVKPKLDERQKFVRGRAMTHGFYLFMVANFSAGFYLYIGGELPISTGVLFYAITYLVTLAVISELILHDAY